MFLTCFSIDEENVRKRSRLDNVEGDFVYFWQVLCDNINEVMIPRDDIIYSPTKRWYYVGRKELYIRNCYVKELKDFGMRQLLT